MNLKVENKTCDKVSSRLRITSAEIIELQLIELQHWFPMIVNYCSSFFPLMKNVAVLFFPLPGAV